MSQYSKNRLVEMDEFFHSKIKPRLFKDYSKEPSCIRDIVSRFDFMINYNVPHGKKVRGLIVYEAWATLQNINLESIDYDKDSEANEQTLAIAWCIEFLQAAFLIADDIMDSSLTRRGKTCWYLYENTGNMAINDAFYLISLVYKIIHEFTQNHSKYNKLYEVFTMALTNTVIGQGLDLITPPKERTDQDKFDFTNYTEETYYQIVKWKTAYYSFCLPVQAALFLADIGDEEVHEKCREILLDMGTFFQVQDDYIDCYGDPKITGKIGTDIEESKCGWLVIQALKKCNAQQRSVLEDYYGRPDQPSVLKIKQLYNDLELKEEYESYENMRFEAIMNNINNLTFKTNREYLSEVKQVLRDYAAKIFKRNK